MQDQKKSELTAGDGSGGAGSEDSETEGTGD